ncbi:MAG: LPS export ABC transporter periplasmic protein LptC [Gammaproteobacteria bacterium]|nr:LPS export ABC transporter periplasmic protein LptC [Gammaproteobacteria bacterium]
MLTVLGLLAALVVTGWLLGRLDDGSGRGAVKVRHDPDWYMENFTQRAMDASGAIARRLSADFMVHYPDDDSSELVRPVLELYNEDPEPWRVIAERGWVGANGEVVLLYGSVEIWRNAPEGGREIEVLTRDLRVLPEEQYAESDHPTTIRKRMTVTHAVGMRADFGAKRLELLTKVRSRYDVRSEG